MLVLDNWKEQDPDTERWYLEPVKVKISKGFNPDLKQFAYDVTMDNGNQLFDDAKKVDGFDIYVLDIIMPGLSGIQLGAKLRSYGFDGKILYLTSSDEYGVDAFKVQASNYIMKPVKKEELISSLNDLVASIKTRKEKSLIIKSKDSSIKLNFDNILYAELSQKTIVYYLMNGKKIESMSIRSTFSEAMQELLRDNRFALCGSSRIVNLHYITELDDENIMFINGAKVYVGRRAGRKMRSVWYDFWFNGEGSK